MFHRFGLMNRNQKGFTLVELMLAFVIAAIIAGGVTDVIFQVFTGNTRASNHMTAVRQVQNAGYWVSHDAQMAQNVYANNLAGSDKLKLDWLKWGGTTENITCNITYSIVDGSKLQRREEVTTSGPPPVTTVSTSVVARYIDPNQTSCDFTFSALVFTVRATVGSGLWAASENRTYEIFPRPG